MAMTHGTRMMGRWCMVAVLAWPTSMALAQGLLEPVPPAEDAPAADVPADVPPDAADVPVEDMPPSAVAEEAAERAAAAVADDPGDRTRHTMDGMIGQVNGRPIYARRVLEPVRDQLTAMSRQLSRNEFRQDAARLIAGQLDQIVTDALVLGAAERDLTEQERMGLRHMVRQRREQLLRQHGQGSLAVAERQLQDTTGMGLDDTLEAYRQEVIVQRYLHRRLFPQINVTRRDIRRYYQDRYEQFNPQGERMIELIRTGEADESQRIADALAEGVLFADASDEVRQLAAPGEAPLAHDALNEALAELAQGEHAGPIEAGDAYWFIRVAEVDQQGARSLRDAQLEIENLLRGQQFRTLSEQYRRDLFAEGSYNPIDEMTASLLEIAMSRYAPSE
ncbi:peptidyl-prolyl cis-trans isomerase [Phycisphaerales bacterium AB-hyl4]|uniref:Periplasmic chaperone PpiD n=1 Tax=Natronomicrosphaera hydrolytica TaxID=3242702 RepID=A0ABV4U7M9_9BACT